MSTVPVGYGTFKDEHGDETLSVYVGIKDGTVELDWKRPEDTNESRVERLKQLAPEESEDGHPLKGQAVLALRLYRRGNVHCLYSLCLDEEREQHCKRAKEVVLAIYDSVYPDEAHKAQRFVEEQADLVIKENRFTEQTSLTKLAELSPNFQSFSPDQYLSFILDNYKRKLVENGDADAEVSWVLHVSEEKRRILTFRIEIPYAKYRWGRAIAEVAKRVNAEAVILTTTAYVLDGSFNRTGKEVALVRWINPDGSVTMEEACYTRRKHPQVERDIITFEDSPKPQSHKNAEQWLIPAWGEYIVN